MGPKKIFCFKRVIIFLLFTQIYAEVKSQKAIVRIEISGQDSNLITYLSKPDTRFVQKDKLPDDYKQIFVGKKTELEIQIKEEIFSMININNERGLLFVICPNDTIDLKINKSIKATAYGYHPYNVTFKGSNAMIHQTYLDSFYPIGKTYTTLGELTQKKTNYDSFFLESKAFIDKSTAVFDSLLYIKQVSPECYRLYKMDVVAGIYDFVWRNLSKVKTADSSHTNYVKWFNTRQNIFFHGKAADPYLLKTYIGSQLHQRYLRLIISEDPSIKDSLLKSSDISHYYAYDSSYREKAWGSYLLYTSLRSPFKQNSADNKLNNAVFESYYPKSLFLKEIRKVHDSVKNIQQPSFKEIIIHDTSHNSLSEFFLPLKGRFFFINLWTSWSGPCINEFAYVTQLEKSLDSLNIQKVYISIDEKEGITEWKSLIQKHYLKGHHFIANSTLQKEILTKLDTLSSGVALSIPRYVLFDKETGRYYSNLPKPSSGHALVSILSRIIKDLP